MVAGKLMAAHALTEPKAGSDASLQATATKSADGYRLSGTKHLVSLAPLADLSSSSSPQPTQSSANGVSRPSSLIATLRVFR